MGGNVFDMGKPIERENINSTLDNFFAELKSIFPKAGSLIDGITPVGSVGKKPISGDLDLVMDGEAISKENLSKWNISLKEVEPIAAEFKKRSRTATEQELYRRAVLTLIADRIGSRILIDPKSTGAGTLFFMIPQVDPQGQDLGTYVQADVNVGKKDWLTFSYFSDKYEGNVKGLHRTQLLASLFSAAGYTFSHGFGIKDKETGETVANSPQAALDILNGKLGTNLTVELVQNFYTLFKHVEEVLTPEQLQVVLKSYMRRLKQAGAVVPPEVQKYLPQELTEQVQERVGILPGGFKPPHKGHFYLVEQLGKKVDLVLVIIGPKDRDGVTADQSARIWEVYRKYLPTPIAIVKSEISPVKDVYSFLKDHQHDYQKIHLISTQEDLSRYNSFAKKRDEYPNVELQVVDPILQKGSQKLSASDIRNSDLKGTYWMPDGLSKEDQQKVLSILSETLLEIRAYLTAENSIGNSLLEFFSKKQDVTLLEEPTAIGLPIPSKDKKELNDLYQILTTSKYITSPSSQDYLFLKPYRFSFQQNRIVVTVEELSSTQDLTEYVDSLMEYMRESGYSVDPQPTVNFNDSLQEGTAIFNKTGYYDPETFTITIFTEGRHPKDVLRTFAHEMIHHVQNVENRLPEITTTNTTEDSALNEIEQEAYLEGNMIFRMWEDTIKNKAK